MKSVVLCDAFYSILRNYYDFQLFGVLFRSLHNLFLLVCSVRVWRFGFVLSCSKSCLSII